MRVRLSLPFIRHGLSKLGPQQQAGPKSPVLRNANANALHRSGKGKHCIAMPPLPAGAAFLVLEFVAGNRSIPNSVLAALLASLPSPSPSPTSLSPPASRRLRRALALRALHAALHADEDPDLLLRKAGEILADPHIAACFSYNPPCSLRHDQDEARAPAAASAAAAAAAAAVADLKRLLDREWATLPPSTLELAADRVAGAGPRALETWATANDAKRRKLRLLVGESTEREILAKLGQHTSASHPSMASEIDKAANATGSSRGANETDPCKEHNEADPGQEDQARHQQGPVKGALFVQLQEKSVASGTANGKAHDAPQPIDKTAASHVIGGSAPDINQTHPIGATKRNLMERNPTATTYEWDGSGGSDEERSLGRRNLPPFERKPKYSPICAHKTRKKWNEVQEKTLMEGVEKYGKGNWKDIKIAYPDVFEDRSTVDLKDKFRNMERYQCG
ncbi:hypothetical protein ACP4OV_007371 [Aristida adscensionis]